MSVTTLYGLSNCDSCKKARSWLADHGIVHHFHDFKKEGLSPERLDHWLASHDWESLINRRGTTWRRLAERDKADLNASKARKLMLANTSLIKRPVLEVGAAILIGFDSAQYDVAFEGAD